MRERTLWFIGLAASIALLTGTGCVTPTGTQVDRFDARALRTFSVTEAGGLKRQRVNLEFLRGVQQDVEAELVTKGYQRVAPQEADFLLEPEWFITSSSDLVAVEREVPGEATITAVKDVQLTLLARERATGAVVWKHVLRMYATRDRVKEWVRREVVRQALSEFPAAGSSAK